MLAPSVSSDPFRILLVEDNPAHAELIMRSFEDHRITNNVTHFTEGETALAYLFQRGPHADERDRPKPHMILLDLHLPGVNGLEVLKKIKASEDLRSIPVVVLTTSKTERDVALAYEQHANSFVIKPPDFERFSNLMSMLGLYWLEQNYLPWS